MLGIPRRYSHFIFGAIQAALTCLIAAGIASIPAWQSGHFVKNWLLSWAVAWVTMLPVVILAAPMIRSISHLLTRE